MENTMEIEEQNDAMQMQNSDEQTLQELGQSGDVQMRNSECGTVLSQMRNSECGTVLSQMRNAECGIRNEDTDESGDVQMQNSECGVRMCEHPENTSLGEVRLAGGSHAGSEASRNEENCFGTDGNDADGLKAESAPQGSWDSAWEVEMEKQKRIQAENKFECLRYLDEKGLPLSLIDVIGEGSLEKMKGAIDSLLQIITSRVRDEVKSRLVSVTPPPSKTISPSYADFQKMSLGEMQKIYSTNRMLYNELTQNNKK